MVTYCFLMEDAFNYEPFSLMVCSSQVDFIMECLSAWKEEDTTHMDQLSLILGLKPPVSPRKFIRAMVVKLETRSAFYLRSSVMQKTM